MITPFVFSTLMAMLNMISVYGVSCRMNTEAAAATLGVYNPFQPSFFTSTGAPWETRTPRHIATPEWAIHPLLSHKYTHSLPSLCRPME